MDYSFDNLNAIEDLFADTENNWYLPKSREGCLARDDFDYHITFGNEKIVFIKAGAGETAKGHEDKQ